MQADVLARRFLCLFCVGLSHIVPGHLMILQKHSGNQSKVGLTGSFRHQLGLGTPFK